jgi:hypothetical protein
MIAGVISGRISFLTCLKMSRHVNICKSNSRTQGGLTMGYKSDDAAMAINLLIRMANIIDEKPDALEVGISSKELCMGYRAWTIKLREAIKLINDLQAEKYGLKERIRILEMDLESRPDMEELNDENKKKIWDYYERLIREEVQKGQEG